MWTGVFSQKMRWIRETILDQINFKKIPSIFQLKGNKQPLKTNIWNLKLGSAYLRRNYTHLLSVKTLPAQQTFIVINYKRRNHV